MAKSIIAGTAYVISLSAMALLGGCGKEPPPIEQPPPAATAAQQVTPAAPQPATTGANAPVATESQAAQAASASYSAEALESLLAPVALYPDPVLAQVLATSANPQEVLDAGNWLIQNPDLSGDALEAAALGVGFTPPMVALVQFPTVVDMMCMEMDWTTELGTAFLADEPGVLNAVQRLRKQAADLGNLETSGQMKVTTETVNDQQVIVVQPAQPEVVYVPQYDPAAVYTTPAPAQAATTEVVTESSDDGYSGGEMITAGLLSFGAGILVNEVFSDDDDDDYYPQWGGGYGGPAYYPPPYQPRYGNGYRPAHSYNRPANYQRGSNNNIYVNTDGNDYFKRFDGGKNNYRRNPDSPISNARPDRPELADLNNRKPTLDRPQGSYAGARPELRDTGALDKRPAGVVKPPDGTYAGARPELRDAGGLAKRPAAVAKPPGGTYAGAKLANKERPKMDGTRDRGHPEALKNARPSGGGALAGAAKKPQAKLAQSGRPGGFQGTHDSGRFERAASQRGRDSMAQRPRPSADRSGGGKLGKKR